MIECLLLSFALAACGGGGGGGPDASQAPSAVTTAVVSAPEVSSPTESPAAAAAPIPVAGEPQAQAAVTAPRELVVPVDPTTPVAPAIVADDPLATTAVAASRNKGSGTTTGPAPVVLNASRSARAGDLVSVQGENFSSAPRVWLDAVGSTPITVLSTVNQVGTGWFAVQISPHLTGALVLRVGTSNGTSAAVKLNAATPHHLDAAQLVPGGSFRIFGRNLLLPGSSPSVTVDGLVATVNVAASDEHQLVVTAPVSLRATAAAVVAANNGNGTGSTTLARTISVANVANNDVFGVSLGWASAFAPLVTRTVNAVTDARMAVRVVCDGRTDDGAAIQDALILAQRQGGGVVQLPAGTCLVGRSLQMLPGTVLQGAGMDRTELRHSVESVLYAADTDLIGVRELTLSNTGRTAMSSLNFRNCQRLLVQAVRVNQGLAAKAYVYRSTNVAIIDSEFVQTGSLGATGAVHATENRGVAFLRNRISFFNETGTNFDRSSDLHIQGNTWTRDASRQTDPGVVHTVTVNFAHRFAMVANTFNSINGPVDPNKNDGETILTEGGGAGRTEGLGMVTSAGSTTLADPVARINPNAYVNGQFPDNLGLVIINGKGAGQARRVVSYSAGNFTVDRAWDVIPDATSRYATAVWGLEKAVIKGNTLSNNPRGIILWSTAVRELDIISNTMNESGGILLRGFQHAAQNWFSPLLEVRVEKNSISNSARLYPSHLSVHFASMEAQPLGLSHVGIEVRDNRLTANSPNIDSQAFMGHAGVEGYMVQMNIHTAVPYEPNVTPQLLGTVIERNTCSRCATAIRLGTGASGTVLKGNLLVSSGALWSNLATTGSTNRAELTKVE